MEARNRSLSRLMILHPGQPTFKHAAEKKHQKQNTENKSQHQKQYTTKLLASKYAICIIEANAITVSKSIIKRLVGCSVDLLLVPF